MPSGPRPSRAASMCRMSLASDSPKGAQPNFAARNPALRSPAARARVSCGRPAEQHRGVGQLRIGFRVTQKLVGRHAASPAEQVPHRHLDSRPRVGRLKQVHAVVGDGRRHAGDVLWTLEPLAEHGRGNRPAGAMRHGRHEGGDRGQRRGFAFAPALVAASRHAHEKRVLAAVCRLRDDRHGEVEEINAVDLHGDWCSCSGRSRAEIRSARAGALKGGRRNGGFLKSGRPDRGRGRRREEAPDPARRTRRARRSGVRGRRPRSPSAGA